MAILEPIIGRYLKLGGTRIFFDEIGSGIPIVCIHTAGANSLQYREMLPLLAGKGFRAIALDLPGHGRSYLVNDEPFRDMHPYAEFVWSFVQEVCEEKPIIMGCSLELNMGGFLQALTRMPVQNFFWKLVMFIATPSS